MFKVSLSKKKKGIVLLAVGVLYMAIVNNNLAEHSQSIKVHQRFARELRSQDLGGGECSIDPLADDAQQLPPGTTRFLLASYPGSGKRFAWTVIKALSNYEVADDWNLSGKLQSNPFTIKSSWPHREGIWSWGESMDEVILLVRNPRWAIPSYHNIRFELDFASDWLSSYSHIFDTYTRRPAVAVWEQWRDENFEDEIQKWSEYIDFWMQGGYIKTEGKKDHHCSIHTHQMDCHPKAVVDFDTFYQIQTNPEFFKIAALLDSSHADMIASQARECILESVVEDKRLHNANRNNGGDQQPQNYRFTVRQLESMLYTMQELKHKYSSLSWIEDPQAQSLTIILDNYITEISKEYNYEINLILPSAGRRGGGDEPLFLAETAPGGKDKSWAVRRDLEKYEGAMLSLYGMVVEDDLPQGVTQDDLTNHFQSCATEYIETKKLKNLSQDTADAAVASVIQEAYSMKNTLIAEESAVVAANIVLVAAQVAAAALSWIPFVNLGLEAASVVAMAVAQGVQIDADSYKDTVVEYITSMNKRTTEQPGMNDIAAWYTANSANGLFYPRLDLGVGHRQQRAIMQAIPVGIHKLQINNQTIDAEGYKSYIKIVGEFILAHKGATMDQIKDLVGTAIENPNDLPVEIHETSAKIKSKMADSEEFKILSVVVDSFALLVIFSGAKRAAVATAGAQPVPAAREEIELEQRAQRESVKRALDLEDEDGADLPELSDLGEPLIEGEDSEGALGGETSWLRDGETIGKAVEAIGVVVLAVFAGFEISDIIDLDTQLTDTIDKTGKALTDYYHNITSSSSDDSSPPIPYTDDHYWWYNIPGAVY